ncbi:MAG: hypothetical protein ABR540_17640 [Acidimicrobiales bacterium]
MAEPAPEKEMMQWTRSHPERRSGSAPLSSPSASWVRWSCPRRERGRRPASDDVSTLPAGTAAGLEINGVAVLSRTTTGTTGRVVVRGLEPGSTYAAHLHTQPCAAAQSRRWPLHERRGGRWRAAQRAVVLSGNPTAGITAIRAGVASGRGTADWVATADARAVVIHAIPAGGTTAGGPKIACADLG